MQWTKRSSHKLHAVPYCMVAAKDSPLPSSAAAQTADNRRTAVADQLSFRVQ